jgi:hypothetical protein
MTDGIAYEFECATNITQEGMLLAGRSLLRTHRVSFGALQMLFVTLMILGGAALVWLVSFGVFGNVQPLFLLLWLGGMASAATYLLAQQWTYRVMAQRACDIARASGQLAQKFAFAPSGLTLTTRHTTWQADWNAVTDVIVGKSTITFCVGTVAMTLPRTVMASAEVSADFLAKVATWRQQSSPAGHP